MASKPLEVFYSYSHRDERLRDELDKHLSILKRQNVIKGWHDRKIGAGKEWAGQIDGHLNDADIILLLISADFLASDYCYDVEMERAMQRHEMGQALIIPIILRPVDWKEGVFGKLQALPIDAKPVTSWGNRDRAFENIARGIREAVEKLAPKMENAEEIKSSQLYSQYIKKSLRTGVHSRTKSSESAELELDSGRAKTLYATLHLQDEGKANQQHISQITGFSMSEVAKTLKQLCKLGYVKSYGLNGRTHSSYRTFYKVDVTNSVTLPETALLLLKLIEYKENDKEEVILTKRFVGYLSRFLKSKGHDSGGLTKLTHIKERFGRLVQMGYIDQISTESVRLLPKTYLHRRYLELIAKQPSLDSLRQYEFTV